MVGLRLANSFSHPYLSYYDRMRQLGLTILALLAFAGNSVLCRLALADGQIDAASFSWVRLLTGVVTLWLLVTMSRNPNSKPSRGSWVGGVMLFLYAVTFSYAYVSLETGTGALILFGTVQLTMITAGLWGGQRLVLIEWLGLLLALSGLAYLLLPGASAPSLLGFALMTISGIAWGCYSLVGKHSTFPLWDTAYNFYRTLPLVVVLFILTIQYGAMTFNGVVLAMISGGVTSAIGYAIWYRALDGLSAVQAAVVQLLVPVIAAVGGVLFADESFTPRIVVSSLLILGGILAVILGKEIMQRKSRFN